MAVSKIISTTFLIVATFTVLKVSAEFECDFEKTCTDWVFNKNWQLQKAGEGIGPKTDHTIGNGHYLIAKSTGNEDDTLLSHMLMLPSDNSCLTFSVNLEGNAVLEFYADPLFSIFSKDVLMTRITLSNEKHVDKWQTIKVPLKGLTSFKKIKIVARLQTKSGYIAVDDLSYSNEICTEVDNESEGFLDKIEHFFEHLFGLDKTTARPSTPRPSTRQMTTRIQSTIEITSTKQEHHSSDKETTKEESTTEEIRRTTETASKPEHSSTKLVFSTSTDEGQQTTKDTERSTTENIVGKTTLNTSPREETTTEKSTEAQSSTRFTSTTTVSSSEPGTKSSSVETTTTSGSKKSSTDDHSEPGSESTTEEVSSEGTTDEGSTYSDFDSTTEGFTTKPTSDDGPSDNNGPTTTAIVLTVLGVVIGLVVIAVVARMFYKKHQLRKQGALLNNENPNSFA